MPEFRPDKSKHVKLVIHDYIVLNIYYQALECYVSRKHGKSKSVVQNKLLYHVYVHTGNLDEWNLSQIMLPKLESYKYKTTAKSDVEACKLRHMSRRYGHGLTVVDR